MRKKLAGILFTALMIGSMHIKTKAQSLPSKPLDYIIVPPEGGLQLGTSKWKLMNNQTGGSIAISEIYKKDTTDWNWVGSHVHTREDELWYVIEGELTFKINDEIRTAGPGSLVFGPRNRMHAYRISKAPVKYLLMLTPAGIDQLFIEVDSVTKKFPRGTPEFRKAITPLAEKYGSYHQEKWDSIRNARSVLPDSVNWINISTDSGIVHAAVATPKGKGPFPAVIILHGTHGFAQEYVQLAKRFAAKGFIGIAACWFAGRKGPDQRFITPIDFPDAPPLVDEPDRFRFARRSIDSLIKNITALPKIQKHQVALLGHARGAGACLDYVCTHPGKVKALILNSCGYPPGITKRAVEINVPVLMLHGTVNPPSDGSPFHDIELARQFEDALKKANKDVEVKYYEGSDMNALFTNSSQFDDTVERVSNFLQKKFKK